MHFAKLGRVPGASNRVQAEVPRGATVLPNRWGTAPGVWLEGTRGLVVMLPGVPYEMRKLLRHEVVPRLAARARGTVVRSRVVRTTSIPESALAERLGDVETDIAPLTLAYLPGEEGVDLRLTAWDLEPAEADDRLRGAADLLRSRAGDHIYGEGDADLAAIVLDAARARGMRLAVAESCTGGLLAKRLTDTPGSSHSRRCAGMAGARTDRATPRCTRLCTHRFSMRPHLEPPHRPSRCKDRCAPSRP